jgi:hypothetical protein
MRRSKALCLLGLLVGVLLAAPPLLATAAVAQPVEIEPEPPPSLTEYRPGHDSRREEARRMFWVEEAERIALSRQDVVRNEDDLQVRLVPGGTATLIFRTTWGLDPGVLYLYQGFDEIGQFHVVSAGMVDNEGHFLLISARTGSIYRIHGMPIYSPDKTRFFAKAFNGMGCIAGVAVYRYQSGKLFREGEAPMGCDHPCEHTWSGSNEIASDCKSSLGAGRVQYRITLREGKWHSTTSSAAR